MITAIVPSNRPAATVLPTLWAIASQTFRPDRIVVVDDTPTEFPAFIHDDRAAWFCLREGIRVLRSTAIGVPEHPQVGGYERLARIRPAAAGIAGAGWAWFVDDDVLPHPDCLERLIGTVRDHDCRAVAASVDELVPQQPPYWPRDAWAYMQHHRPGSRLVGATGLGCTLVGAARFAALTHRTLRPDLGLEDVIATAQLAILPGGVRVSGDARALHLRTIPATWAGEAVTLDDLAAALLPIVGDDGWSSLLPLIGGLR